MRLLTKLCADSEPEDDDDDLADPEIDKSNIITSGRRTRGKQIDFSKINVPEDDEEDDDDDFTEKDEEEAK